MKSGMRGEILKLIGKYSAEIVLSEVQEIIGESYPEEECTIIVNKGLHSFPEIVKNGEEYVFYEGSLDLTSSDVFMTFMTNKLKDLAIFLKSKKWRRVFLVISGHAAVCMQIKLAVYRITRLETIDWVFDGQGRYLRVHIPMKDVLTD